MKVWRNASTGTPGVYRYEETPGAAITGLSSGIPLFIGYSAKGFPADLGAAGKMYSPCGINSWSQFVYAFGDTLGKYLLAYAVRGFFSNGGTTCYVVGIDPADAPDFPSELIRVLADIHDLPVLENVDLVCVPDIVISGDRETVCGLQQTILDFCRGRGVFQGSDLFCFAVLDAVKTADDAEVTSQRMSMSSPDGALYYPWIRLADGPAASGGFVPPCGHIAGIYARSDSKTGVHKAPANEIIEEALDIGADITDAVQDRLNPDNINCLRSFPGRGIRVWGARTLSTDADWRYINVRRLFLAVCRWAEKILADMVFEPNDIRLWMRVTRELNTCLTDLCRQGAFAGETIEQAFYVKCDAETNSADIRDHGELVVEIGLAAAIPGEYIVVRIIQTEGGTSITSSADSGTDSTPKAQPYRDKIAPDVAITE
ncbi:MAG TPA: phage tail sheath subtilisin-like domain-containing protein [Geobacteraceae bacterium]|nr:phage tail sheath subtilisin-like domain-containing protein [Geobacteraceae bacterium]